MPGFTCAVPGCFNNTAKNKDLSFYRFPQDKKLCKLWIAKMKRRGLKGRKFSEFKPTIGHRLCSAHFEGGKRNGKYDVPSIFPLIKQKNTLVRKTRTALDGIVSDKQEEVREMEVEDAMHVVDYIPQFTHNRFGPIDHLYAIQCEETDYVNLGHMLKTQMNNICDIENELSKTVESKMDAARNFKTVITRMQEHNRGVISGMEDEIKELQKKLVTLEKQNSRLKHELKISKAENFKLASKVKLIKATSQLHLKEANKKILNIESIKTSEEMLNFYTGFSHYGEFQMLFNLIKADIPMLVHCWQTTRGGTSSTGRKSTRKLSPENSLLIVLVRLRNGLLEQDLAYRFGVSQSTISRTLTTYLDLLYCRLLQIPIWPSREVVDQYMPSVFKETYPTTRVILDCTELFIETPSQFRVQAETYSSYKSHNTAKGLIAIAPNGFVSFVSNLAPGRMSDVAITTNSGILDLLQDGDSIMADRGFTIDEECVKRGIQLNIPPFMKGKSQLTLLEENETRQIASLRIHVERVIARVKDFKILKHTFPNSMANDLNKIWNVCCYLVNFVNDPIIAT